MTAAWRQASILASVTVLATACGAAGDSDEPGAWYRPSELVWGACEQAEGAYAPEMECATLPVPVDWSARDGVEITLNVARLPATDAAAREGVVIVLSGGPGASGIDELSDVADGLREVRERFDLVAHEPRTAQTRRALPESCYRRPGAILGLPDDAQDYDRMLEPVVEGVQRCRSDDESGLVDHLDGLSQAMDVEAIRLALDEERVNFTAQSYGGVVVATYARRFPERIRAAYVDGSPSHPDAPLVTGVAVQRRNFERFADWCEATPECALYGEDVRRLWRDLTDRANRSPIPATSEMYGDVELSGAQLHFLTRSARGPGSDRDRWLRLAEDIDRARRGDASAFADFALGNLDVWSTPVTIAMQCSDGMGPGRGYQRFRDWLDRVERANPYTYGASLLALVCGGWPVPVANPPAPLPGEELPPFLGAGTARNDFAWTDQLLGHIPGSVTIEVAGTGHVVYLPGLAEPANRCVLGHLSRYLIELELPPEGVECEPASAARSESA